MYVPNRVAVNILFHSSCRSVSQFIVGTTVCLSEAFRKPMDINNSYMYLCMHCTARPGDMKPLGKHYFLGANHNVIVPCTLLAVVTICGYFTWSFLLCSYHLRPVTTYQPQTCLIDLWK